MPKGTPVHRLYDKFRKEGRSKESSARIAQHATGKSLKTGRKPKRKK